MKKKIKRFFKPTWKKIVLTILIIILLYLLFVCFPTGIYDSPSTEKVLRDKPYCHVFRRKESNPLLSLFSSFFLWLPLFFSITILGGLVKKPILIILISLYYFALAYTSSCLVTVLFKKIYKIITKAKNT